MLNAVSLSFTVADGTFDANDQVVIDGLLQMNGGTYLAKAGGQTFLYGINQTGGNFVGGSGDVTLTLLLIRKKRKRDMGWTDKRVNVT